MGKGKYLNINILWYYYAVLLGLLQVITVVVDVSISPIISYPIMAASFLLFFIRSSQNVVKRNNYLNAFLILYTSAVVLSIIPFCLLVKEFPIAYFVSVLAFFVPFALFRASFNPDDFSIRVKYFIRGLFESYIICLIIILISGHFLKSATEGLRFVSGLLGPALISRLAIFVILYCILKIFDNKSVFVNYLLFAFGLMMLIISGSKIGIVSLGLIGIVILIVKIKKKITLAIISIVVILFFLLNLNKNIHDKITFFMEYKKINEKGVKTLNGRTVIWDDVLARVNKSFLFGYGYGAPRIILSQKYDPSLRINILQSHNAWLESMLNVGLIGTTFLLLLIIKTFVNLYRIIKFSDNEEKFQYSFMILYLLYHMIRGITEASFAQASTMEVIVFFSFVLIAADAIAIEKRS